MNISGRKLIDSETLVRGFGFVSSPHMHPPSLPSCLFPLCVCIPQLITSDSSPFMFLPHSLSSTPRSGAAVQCPISATACFDLYTNTAGEIEFAPGPPVLLTSLTLLCHADRLDSGHTQAPCCCTAPDGVSCPALALPQ